MPLLIQEYNKIQKRAYSLLLQCKITNVPVPVIDIATSLSIDVLPYDLGDTASGILFVDKGKGTIGYNPNDPEVRQRFTIAHELGHFVLHCNKSMQEKVFIDRDFIVKFRNQKNYSSSEFLHEQEANTFAAALLMPEDFVRKELEKDIYDDLAETEAISSLAKAFHVSNVAMTYRLTNLNIAFQ